MKVRCMYLCTGQVDWTAVGRRWGITDWTGVGTEIPTRDGRIEPCIVASDSLSLACLPENVLGFLARESSRSRSSVRAHHGRDGRAGSRATSPGSIRKIPALSDCGQWALINGQDYMPSMREQIEI